MDRSHQGIERGYAQVKLRLERMGALGLADQLLSKENEFNSLSWVETEAMFFPDSKPRDRTRELAHLGAC